MHGESNIKFMSLLVSGAQSLHLTEPRVLQFTFIKVLGEELIRYGTPMLWI
jgi:hypothetical protein